MTEDISVTGEDDVTDDDHDNEDEVRGDETGGEGLAALALDHGFVYRYSDAAFARRFSGPPFDEPGQLRALDVVTGRRDRYPIVAFRLEAQPLSGIFDAEMREWNSSIFGANDRQKGEASGSFMPDESQRHIVVATALPGPMPAFTLVPRDEPVNTRPFGREYEPEDADVAERYQLFAANGEVASGVLHLDAVEWLRSHRTMDWRIEGRDLLAIERIGYHGPTVDELLATIEALVAIARGIPAGLHGLPAEPYPPPATIAP